ncbi:MAG: D-alanyl-D-alanine carboxypeptidase family protein [Porcipelethomonas sp.]
MDSKKSKKTDKYIKRQMILLISIAVILTGIIILTAVLIISGKDDGKKSESSLSGTEPVTAEATVPSDESSANETEAPTEEETEATVSGSPKYEIVNEDGLTYVDGILIANKTYSLPADYDPGVDPEALEAFERMQADAAAEGLDIYISSDYRSYYDQERIYQGYCEYDDPEVVDTYSSRPGHSDHQTGLTFDLNTIDDSFGYTPESDWVSANCYKYGFIIRYPENKEEYTGYQYEPWHIRYIGVEKAAEVYESGLSLEEFLGIDSKYKD